MCEKIRTRIWCMLLPKDDKHLFIGDAKKSLIQLSTSSFVPVKIYQGFPEDIYSFACTSDSNTLFAGHYKGYLTEICVESQEVSKSYGKIHFDSIVSMEIDPKDKMLWTSGYDHYMKQINIPEQKVFKCLGQIQANDVEAICKFFCPKQVRLYPLWVG
jgi:WD40 repeat protein